MKRCEGFRIRKFRRIYDRGSGKFKIHVQFQTRTEITPRTIGVAEAFGLGVDDYKEYVVYDDAEFKIGPKDVVYITGESGSGKSVLLRAIEKDLGGEVVNVDGANPDPNKPIVETVGRDLKEALELLSRVGLNDAYLFLRRYRELSDGQRYRYRIAKLIESGKQWWVMDEFCATLDRETAKIVAFNVQKHARREGKAVIVATTHTDLLEDLAPSVHIHKGWGKRLEVRYYPNRERVVCSVARGLRIEEGTLEDYEALAPFHYRNPETRPVTMKIFALKRDDNEPVGVILYSYPPINCSGRKEAVGKKLSLAEVNESLTTISRVILHPKYRSIGLGARLVEETLPLVNRPYIETMAVMAQYSPFFEKAGMRRILNRQPPEPVINAVKSLEGLGFKPYLLASARSNYELLIKLSREEVERVKKALLGVGYFKRLQACKRPFVTKPEFENWIEKQSLDVVAKVLSRLAVLAEPKVYLFWINPHPISLIGAVSSAETVDLRVQSNR
jgi:ABC-type ATPase with predicted acetyltransferase domain